MQPTLTQRTRFVKPLTPVATVEFTAAVYDPAKSLDDRYDPTPAHVMLSAQAPAELREDWPTTVGAVGAWMDLWGLQVMQVAQPPRRAAGSRWAAAHKLTLGVVVRR